MNIKTRLLLAGLALLAPAGVQTKAWAAAATIDTLSDYDFTQASQNGFVFALNAQNMPNSQCSTAGGSNNGVGKRVTATSSQGNAYGNSRCRHRAFQNKTIANGWRVQSVTRTQTCEQNTGSGWQTLSTNPSACEFSVYSEPQVGSNNLFFQADTTVWGNGFNQRRARLEWTITIARTQGISSPWVPIAPAVPTLDSPANNFQYYPPAAITFSWQYPSTGIVVDQFQLCVGPPSPTNLTCSNVGAVTQTNFTLSTGFLGKQLVWLVKACNAGLCTNSVARALTAFLPGAALLDPGNNTAPTNRNFQFRWDLVPNARSYCWEIYTPGNLTTPVATRVITNVGNPFVDANTIDEVPAGTYRWTVKSRPAATENIACGMPFEFQTVSLPPP